MHRAGLRCFGAPRQCIQPGPPLFLNMKIHYFEVIAISYFNLS